MTGRELIKWILDNKAEDLPIEVQYRDAFRDYDGTTGALYLEVSTGENLDKDGNRWTYWRVVL